VSECDDGREFVWNVGQCGRDVGAASVTCDLDGVHAVVSVLWAYAWIQGMVGAI
jgi:hypothetical protein